MISAKNTEGRFKSYVRPSASLLDCGTGDGIDPVAEPRGERGEANDPKSMFRDEFNNKKLMSQCMMLAVIFFSYTIVLLYLLNFSIKESIKKCTGDSSESATGIILGVQQAEITFFSRCFAFSKLIDKQIDLNNSETKVYPNITLPFKRRLKHPHVAF